jgi:transmembrane 9 superfamily protein 2/4
LKAFVSIGTDLRLGYSIISYRDDEQIPLLVNKIFSDHTQLQYAYFDLPFVCPPTGERHGDSSFGSGQRVSLNLGEILRGDRIMTSDFELVMGKDVECQSLCSQEVDRKGVKWGRQLIKDGYVTEWIVDNLPAATSFVTVDRSRKYYSTGFKLGYQDYSPADGSSRFFIHNHYTIVIRWRKAPGKAGDDGGKVIVGFEVYPKSVAADERLENGCPKDIHGDHSGMEFYLKPNNTKLEEMYRGASYIPNEGEDADDGATLQVNYTYSVYFREEDKVEWSNRWNLYFSDQVDSSMTHWLAILNSLTISGVLGVTVIVIWGRTVQGDIKGRGDGVLEEGKLKLRSKNSRSRSRSEKRSGDGLLGQSPGGGSDADLSDEEVEDITGWKLLHADVFRVPIYSSLLAPLVGSGMQLLFVAVGLLILSCMGILNPSFRGGFVSVGVGLFVFAGLFSGYFSSKLYKTFGGQKWKKNTFIVSESCGTFPCTMVNRCQDCFAGSWVDLCPDLRSELVRLGSSI